MTGSPRSVLVFHTAFIGDIVLALPMVQALHARIPDVRITVAAIPSAAALLANHPAIQDVIAYDKRGKDAGLGGIVSLAGTLRGRKFDCAIVPHRSLRSAVVVSLARIPRRIGFTTSAGRWLYTELVRYRKDIHEIDRNLSLLHPLGLGDIPQELPTLHPSSEDAALVDRLLRSQHASFRPDALISVAPGSVWNTKRWPREHFIALTRMLVKQGYSVALIGGQEDETVCTQIAEGVGDGPVLNAAGKLSLLQSASLIGRSKAAVSNDSAPMHLAVAARTPVVAIFGATVPEFGFAPRGASDVVVETKGLPCRPCSIHGGNTCPIKTFVCMNNISPGQVFTRVQEIIHERR